MLEVALSLLKEVSELDLRGYCGECWCYDECVVCGGLFISSYEDEPAVMKDHRDDCLQERVKVFLNARS